MTLAEKINILVVDDRAADSAPVRRSHRPEKTHACHGRIWC